MASCLGMAHVLEDVDNPGMAAVELPREECIQNQATGTYGATSPFLVE